MQYQLLMDSKKSDDIRLPEAIAQIQAERNELMKGRKLKLPIGESLSEFDFSGNPAGYL
jgi:hypothetical protein